LSHNALKANRMKILKVVGVMMFGPMVGAVLGFFLGALLLPPDPTGRGSPGDGFLLILTSGLGFGIFCLASAWLALKIWRQSANSASC
jgi:membrane protein YqaA with SNARE-associated domain